jgi:hypothetical protein
MVPCQCILVVEEVLGKWPKIRGLYQLMVENMGYGWGRWYLKNIRGRGVKTKWAEMGGKMSGGGGIGLIGLGVG